ncbi:DinB family protein [Virgibacillus sp. JSM 102003]|uniref:DinB family protein n=1 Tax=Virgibacillus sp. JSM 102003 TaxID=1562108 RepID=UPI0035C11A26
MDKLLAKHELLMKQYETTRGFFIKMAESAPKEIVDVQPEGFNNTIHWHIGHVLTSAEKVIGYPDITTTYLPENYIDLFGMGTKPSEWIGDVPATDDLIRQLKDQLVRIQQIPAERLNETLDESLGHPFKGVTTLEELVSLLLMHEGTHMGQINAMKRII